MFSTSTAAAAESSVHVGGQGDDASSPDNSSHGAAEALTAMHGSSANGSVGSGLAGSAMGGVAPPSKLAESQSHANISTSLKAMTRHAPSSANLFSAQGGLSSGLSALLLRLPTSDSRAHCIFRF